MAGCPRSGGREGKGCDPYEKGATRGTRGREGDRKREREGRTDTARSRRRATLLRECTYPREMYGKYLATG